MKKCILVILSVAILLSLAGCGGAKNASPEDLIQNFLTAVKEKDYEAIWNMVPEEVQDYAVKEGIIQDKADGLRFIAFAVNDYYWLEDLDLPSCSSFSFRVLENHTHEEDVEEIREWLNEYGIKLSVNDCVFMRIEVTADGRSEETWMFLVKSGSEWYMLSVVGDDEIFEY